MMKNNSTLKLIIGSRYFLLVGLLSLWLLMHFIRFDAGNGTISSIQLSSLETVEEVESSEDKTASEMYYDIYIRLLDAQKVKIQDGSERTIARGSVVSLTVPGSSLSGQVIPRHVDLASVLAKTNVQFPLSVPSQVIISESKTRDLIGEEVSLDLGSIVRSGRNTFRKKAKVLKVSKVEVIDESEEISPEGSVACATCVDQTQDIAKSPLTSGIRNIIDRIMEPISPPPVTRTIDDIVTDYENSETVKNILDVSKKGYRAVRRNRAGIIVARRTPRADRISGSIGACYNGVKTLLLRSGAVENYIPGLSAKSAGPELVKNGFMNLLDTSYKDKILSTNDAPVGSVLVYDGGRHGHIEVRTENGYISDYYNPESRTGNALSGRGRRLIGVYIKNTSDSEIGSLASNELLTKGNANERTN